MKMNAKMSGLLKQAGVAPNSSSWPEVPRDTTLITINESVLLKNQYNGARYTKLTDFPDRTGYECFINHVHLRSNGSRESLLSCLGYAGKLQRALAKLPGQRHFQVILAVAEDGCTVRFHEVRPGENWVADDLEGYANEAVLLLPV